MTDEQEGSEQSRDGQQGGEEGAGGQGGVARYRRRLAGELAVEDKERRRRPLWRRPALLLGLAAAIAVAVTIAADFPVAASHSDTVASVRSYVEEIETDVAPCSFAMGQSWQLYQIDLAHSATPSEQKEIPGLLEQNLEACSYLQEEIVDLAGIAPPVAAGNLNLRGLSTAALAWVDPDALGAITDIDALVSTPGSRSKLVDLAKRNAALVRDRATAVRIFASISTSLHAQFPALGLWQMPR